MGGSNPRFAIPALASALALALCTSCSREKPPQLNLLLNTGAKGPVLLESILTDVATQTDMNVQDESLDFGGTKAVKVYVIENSRQSIMIRPAMLNCEAHSVEPCFSRTSYTVSISEISMFKPRRSLREVAAIFERVAKRYDASLIPDKPES